MVKRGLTMDQRGVSYVALKSVLADMEANKRIQLSIACPSLQKVEKTIPLKIDHLSFVSNYQIQINNALYTFGITRQYREGTPPEPIQTANEQGGLSCDLDEWGFEKPSYRLTETPGDICFGNVRDKFDEGNEADRIRMDREMQEYTGVGEDHRKMHTEYKLLPYRCRENNVKPAHDCFVQLNLTTGDFQQPSRSVQKVPYTKKLHEAMKEFLTFIFGGRKCPVQVNCLEVYPSTEFVRLPVRVKFSVHELRAKRDISSILMCLLPVMDESCLPIKHIYQEEPINLNDPIVANAEEITFHDITEDENWSEFIRNLPHLKVNFFTPHNYNEKTFIEFLKNLLESDKQAGTTYQLWYGDKQEIWITFIGIEAGLMRREVITETNMIIRNDDLKEVQITYRKDVQHEYFGKIELFHVIKLEVLGNRQEING